MNLEFDLDKVTVSEFGVGKDDGIGETFVTVPVDASVQTALREMLQATWDAMEQDEEDPGMYEPSEKHATTEYLYLPLDHDWPHQSGSYTRRRIRRSITVHCPIHLMCSVIGRDLQTRTSGALPHCAVRLNSKEFSRVRAVWYAYWTTP
jgi:hypothetical protein